MFPQLKIKVEHSKLVGATPEKVYAILANPQHHKRILPDAFTSVTETPEGTLFVTLKLGLSRRTLHIRHETSKPNKLFRERDLLTNIVTEFRLEPYEDATLVTIATEYQPRGFNAILEALTAPPLLRQLYEEELTKLCRYALIAVV